MLSQLLTGAAFALSLLIFFRLFTFERRGARFRREVSVLATLLMMACATFAIQIGAGSFVLPVAAWPLVLMQALLALGLVRNRGNLAPLITEWSK